MDNAKRVLPWYDRYRQPADGCDGCIRARPVPGPLTRPGNAREATCGPPRVPSERRGGSAGVLRLAPWRRRFTGLWDRLVAEARRTPGPNNLDTVLTATSAIFQLTDEYALALTEAHRQTSAELLVARQQRRSALAEALFTGEPGPESWPWEAATLLGMPTEGDFVVVCAETAPAAGDGLPGIENRLAELGVASIWRLTPARQSGIVALGNTPLDAVVSVVGDIARTRTGVSPVYHVLRESPRALHLADVAASSQPPGRPAVATFGSSPLAGLVAQYLEEGDRIARAVLGPVLELPADERKILLDTARAWFDCGGSTERAGQAAYCHSNTVRYRLR